MTDATKFEFRTEARQLLDLMVHSVYSNKDIFLRELISNASDALDKLRFAALSDPSLKEAAGEPEIRIHRDATNRTLTVEDNGIGMSEQELHDFIGVIARSGTREFVRIAQEKGSANLPPELIGQFGVGFYSSFMVASEVSLVTRKAGQDKALRWHSAGDGSYTVEPADRPRPGTSVTLTLKPADDEGGLKDYAQEWTLRGIVKKYSDFVAYPIVMKVTRSEPELDKDGNPKKDAPYRSVEKDETLNSMKAIWTRPEKEVTDEEYREFYRHITRDWEEPLARVVSRAEGSHEFKTLLFVPAHAPFDMFWPEAEHGIHLYIRRVFIMNDCKELLPRWLRFVKGVVDSEDLPLNISREILQQDRNTAIIRKHVVKKVLARLEELRDKEKDKFTIFWKEFGKVLKEGVFQDHSNAEAVLQIAWFDSTNSGTEPTSLDDYVGRMKEGQEAIYYLTGRSRTSIEQSPHLEAFKAKGIEVLLLSDPVDEIWVQSVPDYKGKKLQSVGKGEVDLGTEEEKKQQEEKRKEEQSSLGDLLQALAGHLEEQVKEVRLSSRLTSSPACLVSGPGDLTPQLEQMLRATGQEIPQVKRTLEVNPGHPLIQRLNAIFAVSKDDARLPRYARLLYGQAILAEGGIPPEPAEFSRLLAEVFVEATAFAPEGNA
ncbi:MAG: molecular chaperone HtpG [Deltaproteobacteria bacterium]|nr:molecular chaperone HtpG [Deltaproteobacteria bacterium]